MTVAQTFYIGKKGTLYRQRENGSLSRFGVRIDGDSIQLFDQLTRQWLSVPSAIPVRGGGEIEIIVRTR